MFLDHDDIDDRVIILYFTNNILKIYKYSSYELIYYFVFVEFVNIFVFNKYKNFFVFLLKILKQIKRIFVIVNCSLIVIL